MRKLFDGINPVYALDAEAYTTDTTGTDVVDSQGYGDGMIVALSGDVTGTGTDVYTVTLKECDTTDGTFTSTGISVAFSGANQSNLVKSARVPELNLERKRYLRADLTCSATTVAWEGAVVLLLGEKFHGPVNSD